MIIYYRCFNTPNLWTEIKTKCKRKTTMVLTNCLNPMGLLQIFLSDKHRLITRLNCLRLIVRCLTHSCLRVHGADSTFRSSTSLSHSYFPHFDAPSFFFSLLFSNSTPQINLQFLPPFSYVIL